MYPTYFQELRKKMERFQRSASMNQGQHNRNNSNAQINQNPIIDATSLNNNQRAQETFLPSHELSILIDKISDKNTKMQDFEYLAHFQIIVELMTKPIFNTQFMLTNDFFIVFSQTLKQCKYLAEENSQYSLYRNKVLESLIILFYDIVMQGFHWKSNKLGGLQFSQVVSKNLASILFRLRINPKSTCFDKFLKIIEKLMQMDDYKDMLSLMQCLTYNVVSLKQNSYHAALFIQKIADTFQKQDEKYQLQVQQYTMDDDEKDLFNYCASALMYYYHNPQSYYSKFIIPDMFKIVYLSYTWSQKYMPPIKYSWISKYGLYYLNKNLITVDHLQSMLMYMDLTGCALMFKNMAQQFLNNIYKPQSKRYESFDLIRLMLASGRYVPKNVSRSLLSAQFINQQDYKAYTAKQIQHPQIIQLFLQAINHCFEIENLKEGQIQESYLFKTFGLAKLYCFPQLQCYNILKRKFLEKIEQEKNLLSHRAIGVLKRCAHSINRQISDYFRVNL